MELGQSDSAAVPVKEKDEENIKLQEEIEELKKQLAFAEMRINQLEDHISTGLDLIKKEGGLKHPNLWKDRLT